jgi:hypothetical protein
MSPAADDLRVAEQYWRMRLVSSRLLLLLALVAVIAAFSWWVLQRQANAQLVARGELVVAEVIAVDGGRRNSSILVQYLVDGGFRESTIHAPMFDRFSREMLGANVEILVNPTSSGLVRATGSRNMHPATVLAAIASLAATAIAVNLFAVALAAKELLQSREWKAGFLSFEPAELELAAGRPWKPSLLPANVTLRSSDSGVVLSQRRAYGRVERQIAETPTMYVANQKWTLVVPTAVDTPALVCRGG